MENRKKVAIYGGSFSPPHLGHALFIEAIIRLFPCDEIWLMPSADRLDKKITATAEHRFEMCQLMTDELFPNPRIPIILKQNELDRNKLTTTYETKLILESQYPNYEFNFVIGSELLNDIENGWVDGDKLYASANFLAIRRPQPLPKKMPPHLTMLEDVVWNNISSTFVRKLVADGHSGIPYITKSIAEYIKSNNLYH